MFKRQLNFLSPLFSCFFFCLLFPYAIKGQCPEGLITGEQNLIVNGDFEGDSISFTTDYRLHQVADTGRYRIVMDANTFWGGFIGKGEGKFLAVDGSMGKNKIVWQQDIDVKPNTLYFFSAWASNLYTIHPAVLQFSINGQLLDKPFATPKERETWKQFFVNWQSGEHTQARITIVSQNPGMHGNDFGLDRIKFYACESSSLQQGLETVAIGKVIELRNVLFETASATILPASYRELNELATYLKQNPTLEIEISGHTDSVGGDEYNLKLSEGRATSIGRYLLGKGIEAKRLTTKGYGKNVPVADNETLEGRQKNRRVEFKILKL
ncbi:OmpA family protein [Rhodocytophaga aerolata]|uniref:OmpA family protein n=1 Tax=Rhodocytophaga aerolata TaxID=455078 RepID=A0ABT8RI09_9BACT|nr:OmpA family protein [Rhodocytophaga aerolata]MDO1451747.1 OmpA family protein [Rhodocytophaga aerolata]